jgi:hypothetical protein
MVMQAPAVSVFPELTAAAMRSRNRDGGWGYTPGQSSRLEPTCWALAAFPLDAAARASASSILGRSVTREGLLEDLPGVLPNMAFNGLAALSAGPSFDAITHTRLLEAIAGIRGVRLNNSDLYRQNNALQGWPWVGGAFSWVEPTAWCLLALKKHRARLSGVGTRVAEAEALLIDRACAGGGWNYGNSNMMGQDLRPYVPTTALALLALQDRRDEKTVTSGLAWLESHGLREPSGMPLALAAICLRIYDRPAGGVQAALVDRWHRTRFLGSTLATCMAAAALATDADLNGVFRL